MHKNLLYLLTLPVMLLSFQGVASGQDLRGKLSINPFAGMGIPLGILHDNDFDNANAMFRANGLRFGLNAEYCLGRRFAMGVDFSYAIYNSRELASTDLEFNGLKPNDKMRIMLFGVHARHFMALAGRARPYVLMGFGIDDIELKNWDLRPALEEDNYKLSSRPYMQGALGVQVWVNPTISVSAQAGLTYLMTKDASVSLNGTDMIDPETGHAVEIKNNYYIFDFGVGANFWFDI